MVVSNSPGSLFISENGMLTFPHFLPELNKTLTIQFHRHRSISRTIKDQLVYLQCHFENIISLDPDTGVSLKEITNVEVNRGRLLLEWIKEIDYETRTVTLRLWIPDTGWWTSHWEVKDVQADLPSSITCTINHVLVSSQICVRVSDIWIVDLDVGTIYSYAYEIN